MRRKLFYGENLFFRLMGRLGDFMCLNILYLLTSLPVVTAGASVSALYDVLYDISRGKEGGCVKRYIRAFKKHFQKATAYWMICLFLAVFLVSGIFGIRFMNGSVRIFFQGISAILFLLWAGMGSFGFILISWNGFSIREAFGSAVLITIGSFPWLVMNLLITCIPALFFITRSRFIAAFGMPLFILFGIPLLGYIKVFVYKQALKKYGLIKGEEENDNGESAHLSDRALDGYGKSI